MLLCTYPLLIVRVVGVQVMQGQVLVLLYSSCLNGYGHGVFRKLRLYLAYPLDEHIDYVLVLVLR